MNFMKITKKRVAPATQDATMSADKIRVGGKDCFFFTLLQGINKKRVSYILVLVMGLMAVAVELPGTGSSRVVAPTFSQSQGKYHCPIAVEIKCTTPGAKIYYTTDGTTPTIGSTPYCGQPIGVSNHASGDDVTHTGDNDPDPWDEYKPRTTISMQIKAIATKHGMITSDVAEAKYVIDKVEAAFNIAYDNPPAAGGTAHQLDIYRPRRCCRCPSDATLLPNIRTIVLFFVHGGAFSRGDKNEHMELGNTFAGYYNYTTVLVNYELSSAPWYAVHPAHIKDVARAFAWTYKNISKYGGDPEKIYIFGQSAGAHLVALLAIDESYLQAEGVSTSKIKGVITMSGTYNLYQLVNWPRNPLGLNDKAMFMYYGFFYRAFGTLEQAPLDAASPVKHINGSQPPFHIVALQEAPGFNDMPGFSQQTLDFYNGINSIPGHPFVDLIRLKQSDIPLEIQVKYQGDVNGHLQEIFAINTKYYNCLSAATVVDFIGSRETLSPRKKK